MCRVIHTFVIPKLKTSLKGGSGVHIDNHDHYVLQWNKLFYSIE